MTLVQIPEILESKLTRNGAAALIELLNFREKEQLDHTIEKVENKFEKRLGEECGILKSETEKVRSDLKLEIEKVRSDLIKWMFIFWTGQLIAIGGMLFGMLQILMSH